jgi:hypothetical protein
MNWRKKLKPIEITAPRRAPHKDIESGLFSDLRLFWLKLFLPPLAWLALLIRTFPPRRAKNTDSVNSPWTSFRLIVPLLAILVLTDNRQTEERVEESFINVTQWLITSQNIIEHDSLSVKSDVLFGQQWWWLRAKLQPVLRSSIDYCHKAWLSWSLWMGIYIWFAAVTLLLTGLQCLALQSTLILRQKITAILAGKTIKTLRLAWLVYRFWQILLFAVTVLVFCSFINTIFPDLLKEYYPELSIDWWISMWLCLTLIVIQLILSRMTKLYGAMPIPSPAPINTKKDEEPRYSLPQLSAAGITLPQLAPRNPLVLQKFELKKTAMFNTASSFTSEFLEGMKIELYHHPGLAMACTCLTSSCSLNIIDTSVSTELDNQEKPQEKTEEVEQEKNSPLQELEIPLDQVLLSLFKVLYLVAGMDTLIRPSHNHVIRSFANQYPLCLLMEQKELAGMLIELAQEDWKTASPEIAASAIWKIRSNLDDLVDVGDYMDLLRMGKQFVLPRAPDGVFDPMHSRSFASLKVGFGVLIDNLIQAIVFADRRIGHKEHILLEKLEEAQHIADMAEE